MSEQSPSQKRTQQHAAESQPPHILFSGRTDEKTHQHVIVGFLFVALRSEPLRDSGLKRFIQRMYQLTNDACAGKFCALIFRKIVAVTRRIQSGDFDDFMGVFVDRQDKFVRLIFRGRGGMLTWRTDMPRTLARLWH